MKWKITPPGNTSNLTHVFREVTQCPLPEFLLPFSSHWEDGNLLPVHLRVWGKRKQILGASEGLHCFPDFQLSADLCVSRFKTLQGGEQRGAGMQEGVGPREECPPSVLFPGPPLWFPLPGLYTYDLCTILTALRQSRAHQRYLTSKRANCLPQTELQGSVQGSHSLPQSPGLSPVKAQKSQVEDFPTAQLGYRGR